MRFKKLGSALASTVMVATGITGASIAMAPVANAVPNKPTVLSAAIGDGQVTVSWKTPTIIAGGPITGYTVTSNPGAMTATTNGATSAVVPGLTNGTRYTFTVTATNDTGTSAPSRASVRVTPVVMVISDAPLNVVAAQRKHGKGAVFLVKWQKPLSDGNGRITTYRITASPGGQTQITRGAKAKMFRITAPVREQAYTFTVTATNGAGTSVPSIQSSPVVFQ